MSIRINKRFVSMLSKLLLKASLFTAVQSGLAAFLSFSFKLAGVCAWVHVCVDRRLFVCECVSLSVCVRVYVCRQSNSV
jgi:hypothetical protein